MGSSFTSIIGVTLHSVTDSDNNPFEENWLRSIVSVISKMVNPGSKSFQFLLVTVA